VNNATVSRKRLQEIDAVRGTAMIAVCLSHFIFVNPSYIGNSMTLQTFRIIVRFASPAFMIISGMMLGYLYKNNIEKWDVVKEKLIDRGLFLLSIGHLFMMSGHIMVSQGFYSLLKWEFITDNIGINIIIGCIIMTKLRDNLILALSIIILFSNYLILLNWFPGLNSLDILKEAIIGSLQPSHFNWIFPFLPWLGIYLFGIYIGRILTKKINLYGRENIAKFFISWSLGLMISAMAVKGTMKFLFHISGDGWNLGCVTCRNPASIGFFIFFGSITFALLFMFFKFGNHNPLKIYIRYASMLGRNSFMIFVIQYYIYYTILFKLKLSYSLLWPLYFFITLTIISLAIYFWDRNGLNRLIGIRWIAKSIAIRWRYSA
jgi:uncharacterized membrane protein